MSTFPEYLHSLDDDQLRALIRSRPDAFFPTPPSTGSLATRLSLPGSASRALRQLSAADLAVLEKLADEFHDDHLQLNTNLSDSYRLVPSTIRWATKR